MPSRSIILTMAGGALAAVVVYKYLFRRGSRAEIGMAISEQVVVVDGFESWRNVETEFILAARKHMVLGFDCEWTSSPDDATVGGRPVALLQLATADGTCALVRLPTFNGNFPSSLVEVLADRRLLKVGVSPHLDAKKLREDYGLNVKGYLDLGWLALAFGKGENGHRFGLQALAHAYLGVVMDKSWRIRCSNWDADVLTDKQVKPFGYALVAVRIFLKLASSQLSVWQKILPCPRVSWLDRVPSIGQWVHRTFQPKSRKIAAKNTTKIPSPVETQGVIKRQSLHTLRKTPLYHNCFLQAPDGLPLCTCDEKKAQWYIDKQLGDLVSDLPMTVRLRFEPSGRPRLDQDYYLQTKKNRCVVCGASDSYIRKNVVPHEYRKHFPANLKDHKSHDIILLCITCHQISNLHDMDLKRQLAEKYAAPLGNSNNSRVLEDPGLKTIRSAARALTKSGIPEERRKVLENTIRNHYKVEEISEDVLSEALSLETRGENESHVCHGSKVVSSMEKTEGLFALEQLWRLHFLETMQPKFMPKFWSVHHKT